MFSKWWYYNGIDDIYDDVVDISVEYLGPHFLMNPMTPK